MTVRSVIARIGLVVGGFIVVFTILEVGCRMFAPQPPLSLTKDLLNRGRFTQPGTHQNHQSEFATFLEVNSDGFVDYEWATDQPTDILLIGDSFVQGAQVPMTLSIGRILNNTLNQDVKSMGIPGAGTTTELMLLKHWLDVLKPKIVLVGFLPSNDILNNHPDLESKSDKPFVDLTEWRREQSINIEMNEPSIDASGLTAHSHLIRWFTRTMHTNKIQRIKLSKGDGVPIDWHVYNPEIDSTWTEAWSITSVLFQNIHNLCASKGIILKVLLFPSIEEVSSSYQQHIRSNYPATQLWGFEQGLEVQSLDVLLSAGIEPTNILSLYPAFTSHERPDDLYFQIDHHWTPLGHALASKEVKAWLESE